MLAELFNQATTLASPPPRSNMNRYRVTYTAYLPEPKIDVKELRANRAQDPESVRRMRELDDYTKRLDKQNYKLETADDECLSNLNKVNRYYTSSRKFLCISNLIWQGFEGKRKKKTHNFSLLGLD